MKWHWLAQILTHTHSPYLHVLNLTMFMYTYLLRYSTHTYSTCSWVIGQVPSQKIEFHKPSYGRPTVTKLQILPLQGHLSPQSVPQSVWLRWFPTLLPSIHSLHVIILEQFTSIYMLILMFKAHSFKNFGMYQHWHLAMRKFINVFRIHMYVNGTIVKIIIRVLLHIK